MTKILVTGASGFIGKHLVPELYSAGYEVIELNSGTGDISDESTWLMLPQVEVVIHLAGKSFVPDSWSNPSAFIKCNLMGTIFALDYCKRNKARLVFISSYLYGNPEVLPIPETAPLTASNPYGFSKKLAEEACQFYSDKFDVNIVILRPFNVYGPGQPLDFLIPSIIQQVIIGGDVRVKDIEPKRDYVYVSDLVQAILKAIHWKGKFHIFNIGSGVSYSVENLIQMIQEIKKTSIPVNSSGERRKNEIMNTIADITEAKMQLDWAPQWSLVEGLKQMVTND